MPAHAFEADEALEEGVKIKWLTTIKEIAGPTLTVERMALDDKGRPQPTGEFETLQADAVVLALGQETDSGFLRGVPGIEFQWRHRRGRWSDDDRPSRHFRRRRHGAGERTVTVAVGHGKKAARHIDAWLRGTSYQKPASSPLVGFAMLNLPVFSDADPAVQTTTAPVIRLRRGDGGLSETRGAA